MSKNNLHHRLIILGSGPAGLTAAIYSARAILNPVVISGREAGGQLMITTDVENYPGFPEGIRGPKMMELLKAQALRFGTKFISGDVIEVDFRKRPFKLNLENKDTMMCDSLIISSGASARWLGLESEKEYSGKGVSACATCDGFFFRDHDVAVVGGGDTALEEALYLANICSKVYLVHRRDELRAEKILQDRIFKQEQEGKIEILWDTQLKEVIGDDKGVTSIKLDTKGEESTKDVMGVFIAIGHKPNTEMFSDQLEMDNGYIVIKSGLNGSVTSTSIEGVFAAGDVSDQVYRQAITSAGFGCMAALDAEHYLSSLE